MKLAGIAAGLLLPLALVATGAAPRGKGTLGGHGAPRPEAVVAATPEIVVAERAFCRAAVEKGIRAAFLEFLAEEAVVFRPTPVNARQWYTAQPRSSGVLTWEPEHYEIAASGDLGYTTGPWEFRPDSLNQDPVTFGHYISVWHRRPNGAWRVMVDAGGSHPKPEPSATPPPPGSTLTGRVTSPVAVVPVRQTVPYSTDRAYARDCAARGRTVAFQAHADTDVRICRPGWFPALGRDSAWAALPDTLKLRAWEPIGGVASKDQTLAFTYGIGTFAPRSWSDAVPDSASYLRIWRRAPDRSWKIIVDYAAPIRRARSD